MAVGGRLSAVSKRQDSQHLATGRAEGWKNGKYQNSEIAPTETGDI